MSDQHDKAGLQKDLDALDDMFRQGRLPKERYEIIRKNVLARIAMQAEQPAETAPVTDEEYAALRDAARRPALLLEKTPRPDMPGAPGCWLGGLPTLPPDIAWPWFTYQGKPVAPMHFVAQIDLAQVPDLDGPPARPTLGTLFFFVTPVLSQLLDATASEPHCHVVHVAGDVSGLALRPMPAFPDFADFPNTGEDWAAYYTEIRTTALDRWNIGFRPFDSLGGVADPRDTVTGRLGEEQFEIMEALEEEQASRLPDGVPALHHMFGRGTTSQVVPQHPNATATNGGMCQLLVLDQDSDLGFADYVGRWTTFWIGAEDLAQGRFDRVYSYVEG